MKLNQLVLWILIFKPHFSLFLILARMLQSNKRNFMLYSVFIKAYLLIKLPVEINIRWQIIHALKTAFYIIKFLK